jgi:hypothetical protein
MKGLQRFANVKIMWDLAIFLTVSAEMLLGANIIVVLYNFLGTLCVRIAPVQQIPQISALQCTWVDYLLVF